MKAERKKRSDYAALKQKLYLRLGLTAAAAVLAAFLARKLTMGQFANGIVGFLSAFFRVDWETAFEIYWRIVPNYMGVWVSIFGVLLMLLFFWPLIRSFTGYFDQIAAGIDRLAEGETEEIHLSPELIFLENRLNRLQRSLERKESRSRELQRRKNDLFLYSAHDVKTPLTSVEGYLALLEANPGLPPEERAKYTRIALDKSRELDAMLDEMFEMARYEQQEIRLEKREIDLYSLLVQLREEHFPQLEAGGKRAEIHAPEELSLWADPEKLGRVFDNLMKNAIAYSDPGSVILIRAEEEGGRITVRFQNRCAPVPQEQLDRLFERFYRLDAGRNARREGAGLGLAIAREIVLLHGGTIRAESLPDGLCFTVCLPAAGPEAGEPAP